MIRVGLAANLKGCESQGLLFPEKEAWFYYSDFLLVASNELLCKKSILGKGYCSCKMLLFLFAIFLWQIASLYTYFCISIFSCSIFLCAYADFFLLLSIYLHWETISVISTCFSYWAKPIQISSKSQAIEKICSRSNRNSL